MLVGSVLKLCEFKFLERHTRYTPVVWWIITIFHVHARAAIWIGIWTSTFTQIVFFSDLYSTPVLSVLYHLHWLPVTSCIKYQLAAITYKSLSVTQPTYPLHSCYSSTTNQFGQFVQVTRICWLYLREHRSFAKITSIFCIFCGDLLTVIHQIFSNFHLFESCMRTYLFTQC